ncbi:MAG: hypothetical protein IPN76_30930 [Saprospiraceae bacterium]|nr:hypothetical protein [Saprospiraceae bacterium]
MIPRRWPGRKQLIECLRDVVPNKNYVLLHSTQANLNSNYQPQDWESDQAALAPTCSKSQRYRCANLIRNTLTTGAVPYILPIKKSVGPIRELLADSLKQVLSVNVPSPVTGTKARWCQQPLALLRIEAALQRKGLHP